MDEGDDGLSELAALLGVVEGNLRDAIDGPWRPGQVRLEFDSPVTTFVGLANPRTPGRPLVAIRVEPAEGILEIGKAVGVTVPTGEVRWTLGAPRRGLVFDVLEVAESDWLARALLEDLRDAVHQVVEAAVLRGTSW